MKKGVFMNNSVLARNLDNSTETMMAPLRDEIQVLEGQFSPEEAKEQLLTLLVGNLHYQGLRAFSLSEREGRQDSDAETRIETLTKSKQQAIDLVDYAKQTGKSLHVESSIKIRLV